MSWGKSKRREHFKTDSELSGGYDYSATIKLNGEVNELQMMEYCPVGRCESDQ